MAGLALQRVKVRLYAFSARLVKSSSLMHPPSSEFEQIISKPRLDSYRAYWKVDPDGAVGLYIWNGEVCAEVSKLLAYFEIALRNNIHREMSLTTPLPTPAGVMGTSASSAWWNASSIGAQLKPGTKKKITDVINASSVRLGPDEIVSRLSFGFWPNVLAWIAKSRTPAMYNILPGHPLSQPGALPNWSDAAARNSALAEIFEMKEVRNRIAHLEPLWKFPKVMDAVTQKVIVAPASTNETGTMERFARLLRIYDDAVHALSPALSSYMKTASWRQRLDFLLSRKGVARYQGGLHVPNGTPLCTRALHQEFATVIQNNRPVKIHGIGGEGLFIPL
ncbi:hypothetical protein D5038_09065 [Verminephrobacter aporrectodeae subsp. tuberculatae]|nr:hypothetical protein [Verminephrobacter aporrectodeae subsp. tuberculatae]